VGDPREVVPGVGARSPGVAVAGAELIVIREADKAFRVVEVITEETASPAVEAIPEGTAIPAVEFIQECPPTLAGVPIREAAVTTVAADIITAAAVGIDTAGAAEFISAFTATQVTTATTVTPAITEGTIPIIAIPTRTRTAVLPIRQLHTDTRLTKPHLRNGKPQRGSAALD
jgi:hypothetical protein